MTPEKQRIVIAEFCGWKDIKKRHTNNNPNGIKKLVGYIGYCANSHEPHYQQLPDYLNDLNAIAEAESMLDKEKLNYTYSHFLYNIVVPKEVQPFRATAAQRAEALLRTIGKWEDS